MATYAELFDLFSSNTLHNRVAVACLIAAEAIRNENPATTNHANRLIWAKQAFHDPGAEADRMLKALLAQNAAATVAQINAATDSTIQTAVNASVDIFATGS